MCQYKIIMEHYNLEMYQSNITTGHYKFVNSDYSVIFSDKKAVQKLLHSLYIQFMGLK